MPGADVLLLAHAFATVFMTGLIWETQLVHYPLFARVGAGSFVEYERSHVRRITVIVGPMMLLELACAAWLVVFRPSGVPAWMAVLGAGLLAVIWLSTLLVQGPTHAKLSRGHDERLIRLLVRSNWVRTVCWTARGVVALAMVWAGMRGAAVAGAGAGVAS